MYVLRACFMYFRNSGDATCPTPAPAAPTLSSYPLVGSGDGPFWHSVVAGDKVVSPSIHVCTQELSPFGLSLSELVLGLAVHSLAVPP